MAIYQNNFAEYEIKEASIKFNDAAESTFTKLTYSSSLYHVTLRLQNITSRLHCGFFKVTNWYISVTPMFWYFGKTGVKIDV